MIRRLCLSLFLTLLSAAGLRAADFTGRWEGWPTLPDGAKLRIVFVFTTAADGKLHGSVETDEFGTFPATDVVVEGDKITFNVPTDEGIYRNVGTLKPDGLLIEGTGPHGALDPVLYKRAGANLAGTWRGKVETPDGPAEVSYTFVARDGQFSGTAKSPMGEAPLTNIVVDGASVAFESDFSGFTIKRRGTIDGDTMRLTITIADNEITATFTRARAGAARTD